MDHHTIDVFLFDLGNVILPFNHYQIAEKLARFSEKKELSDPAPDFLIPLRSTERSCQRL